MTTSTAAENILTQRRKAAKPQGKPANSLRLVVFATLRKIRSHIQYTSASTAAGKAGQNNGVKMRS